MQRDNHRLINTAARAAVTSIVVMVTSMVTIGDAQESTLEGLVFDNQSACGGSLICYNGGTCQQGEASWPGADSSLPKTLQQKNTEEGYYCECASSSTNNTPHQSFTGLSCEIPYQECQYPNGFTICYHGGSCLDEAPEVWNTHTPVCNCDTAKHNGEIYVGRNCEIVSHDAEPCDGQESFCLNGGVCADNQQGTNDTNQLCACPKGFEGQRCETITPPDETAECNLQCQNGGICRFNVPGHSNYGGTPLWGTRKYMYCECPSLDFAGIQCEHAAEVCGNGVAVCLHGTKCQAIDDHGSSEPAEFECKCPSGQYLGGVCSDEHRRVQHCNPVSDLEFAFGMAVPAFCANGGNCTEYMVDGLLMPACLCPENFGGPHCEFVFAATEPSSIDRGPTPSTPTITTPSGSKDKNEDDSVGEDYNRAGRWILNLTLLLIFFTGTFFLVRQSIRIFKARRRQDQMVFNLQSFRQENQGAVSANGSMLFPSAQQQPRTGQQFTMEELMHDVEIS